MPRNFNGIQGLPPSSGPAQVGNGDAAGPVSAGRFSGVPQFFCYPIQLVLTGNQKGASVSQSIVNWPFVWTLAIANSTGAFEFTMVHNGPAYTFFNQSGSNSNNGFVLNSNFWGTAQQPAPVLPTYVFGPQTSLTITVNDLSGAGNTINFLLRGFQLIGGNQ